MPELRPQRHAARSPARRRLIASGAGTLAISLAPWQIAHGATLLGVRVWPAPSYTRVAIEHDQPLEFTQFTLDNPPRLVVDVEGIELTARSRELIGKVDADDPYIASLRLGQNRPRVVRVVIELKQDVRPQVFALAPVGPYQHRLVMDLHSAAPVDPLLSLLQQERPPAAEPMQTPSDARPDARKPARERGASEMNRVATVAIDAGHGGEDPGAIGKRGTYEKDVTLAIARRVEALLKAEADVRVLMTRDGDYFVPLHQRVAKARRVGADLFVSIHADAWVRPDARGSSVFALSERGATSSAAAMMARRENDADRVGGIDLARHDPGLARVLLDLSTTAQINDSLKFGNAVLRELERINRLHKPQVEQAGFAVLRAPDIPSILIETAFISNPEEELRLNDAGYQQQIAAAIVAGIRRHLRQNPARVRGAIG